MTHAEIIKLANALVAELRESDKETVGMIATLSLELVQPTPDLAIVEEMAAGLRAEANDIMASCQRVLAAIAEYNGGPSA